MCRAEFVSITTSGGGRFCSAEEGLQLLSRQNIRVWQNPLVVDQMAWLQPGSMGQRMARPGDQGDAVGKQLLVDQILRTGPVPKAR